MFTRREVIIEATATTAFLSLIGNKAAGDESVVTESPIFREASHLMSIIKTKPNPNPFLNSFPNPLPFSLPVTMGRGLAILKAECFEPIQVRSIIDIENYYFYQTNEGNRLLDQRNIESALRASFRSIKAATGYMTGYRVFGNSSLMERLGYQRSANKVGRWYLHLANTQTRKGNVFHDVCPFYGTDDELSFGPSDLVVVQQSVIDGPGSLLPYDGEGHVLFLRENNRDYVSRISIST